MSFSFLKKYNILESENKFYVEAGSNDGIMNSISNFLEKDHNWKGILIDPSVKNINACKKNRSSDNIFINCALVSNDYSQNKIKGNFNLNSGSESAKSKVESLIDLWPPKNGSTANTEVDALKFSEISFQNNVRKIDLFILDVEGYEFEVLNGIDFDFCNIKFFVVEIRKDYNLMKIVKFLYSKGYIFLEDIDNSEENISLTNYLFKKKESEDDYLSEERVLQKSWENLIGKSIKLKIGDFVFLKNNLSEINVRKIFAKISGERNFLVYKVSSGNYIFKIDTDKIKPILEKNKHIKILNFNVKLELVSDLK